MLKRHTQHLLDELRSELRKLANGPPKTASLVAERSTDPIDEARTTEDIELAITSLNADWQTVRAIKDAITKVKTGEYGVCESCGCRIPANRLQAIPWAQLCVRCQAQLEQQPAQAEVYAKIA
jgi:RNA polymerase-binding transcription factor